MKAIKPKQKLIARAVGLMNAGRFGEAHKLLGESGCDDAAIIRLKGQCLYMLGRYEEAEADLNCVLANGRAGFDNACASILLGNIHLKRHDAAKALMYYQMAEILDPGNVTAKMNIAAIESVFGDPEEAIRSLEEAHDADPGNPVPLHNLALRIAKNGNPERALALLEDRLDKCRDCKENPGMLEYARSFRQSLRDGKKLW